MTSIFSGALWPGLVAWLVLFISDYYVTLYCARLYKTSAKDKLVFEGSFELTPRFQKDIDSGRLISPRFIRAMCTTVVCLSIVWFLCKQFEGGPQMYAFLLGAMILSQLTIHVRHIRNLFFYRSGFGADGVQGHIEYPRRLILQMSATELFAFSGLYGLMFALVGSPFLLGGATVCAVAAIKHLLLARKAGRVAKAAA